MTWRDYTLYSIVFTYVNLRSGLSTLAYIFRCRLFPLLLEQHIRFLDFNVFVLGNQQPWSFYSGICNLLLMTNFQYDHSAHIDFNTVHLLYRVIMNKFISWNLITLVKTFECLSINVEGYLWYFFGVMACIVSVPLWLKL